MQTGLPTSCDNCVTYEVAKNWLFKEERENGPTCAIFTNFLTIFDLIFGLVCFIISNSIQYVRVLNRFTIFWTFGAASLLLAYPPGCISAIGILVNIEWSIIVSCLAISLELKSNTLILKSPNPWSWTVEWEENVFDLRLLGNWSCFSNYQRYQISAKQETDFVLSSPSLKTPISAKIKNKSRSLLQKIVPVW